MWKKQYKENHLGFSSKKKFSAEDEFNVCCTSQAIYGIIQLYLIKHISDISLQSVSFFLFLSFQRDLDKEWQKNPQNGLAVLFFYF